MYSSFTEKWVFSANQLQNIQQILLTLTGKAHLGQRKLYEMQFFSPKTLV